VGSGGGRGWGRGWGRGGGGGGSERVQVHTSAWRKAKGETILCKEFLSFEKGKNMAVELMYRTLVERDESMYVFEKQKKGYETIR
jgi:hypothetical protein